MPCFFRCVVRVSSCPCSLSLFIDPVIRHDALDHVPEVLRMVHMRQVAEFVDYYIIQRTGGTVDQAVIEG